MPRAKAPRTRRRWLRWVWAGVVVGVVGPLFTYGWVSWSTAQQVHHALPNIPTVRAALLLGTSARTRWGTDNQFFRTRIDAAVALYQSGKVAKIIVSGDNRHVSYNEPREMHRALVKAGVPDSVIVMDFAGFRTFDSVVRAAKVFGQASFVVISQRFHVERAVFIANAKGIDAHGFVADDPSSFWTMVRIQAREVLARGKTVLDCYILGTEPRFLGEQEPI